MDYVATRLSAIKAKYGPDAIQTTGSSRGTGNETNYVMQNSRAPLLVPITSTAALAFDTALRLQVCTSRSVTAP
ncbi:hypothetical protein IE996_19770 [Klebsiella pneumoniae]|uniref:Uncharacterized protein n=1 Tax=Klebsiella pneumoniae TaxID=573 RepID=A0A927HQ14_KLEPN|nr:hypothetical protein [Klebsiella pneumoniae]